MKHQRKTEIEIDEKQSQLNINHRGGQVFAILKIECNEIFGETACLLNMSMLVMVSLINLPGRTVMVHVQCASFG